MPATSLLENTLLLLSCLAAAFSRSEAAALLSASTRRATGRRNDHPSAPVTPSITADAGTLAGESRRILHSERCNPGALLRERLSTGGSC